MPYRLQGKTIFLTYPQSDFDLDGLIRFLRDDLTKRPTYIIASRELHQDGTPHFHALASYATRVDIRDPLYYDYEGRHPNIQSVRNKSATITYIKKDGDYREWADGAHRGGEASSDGIWEVCAGASRMDWITYCIEHKISHNYMREIWDITHRDVSRDITEDTLIEGTMTLHMRAWLYEPNKTYVIVGDSGVGKTTWAKTHAPKPALWVTHMDDLRLFNKDYHKSIIYDDMTFKHYPEQSQIHLVDMDDTRTIHIRYKTVTIPAKVPKLFTCNEHPFSDHPAIDRRCKYILVRN